MPGPVEIDPLVLGVAFVLGMAIPGAVVYVLAAYHTDRRLGDQESKRERYLADLEDRITRLEGPLSDPSSAPRDDEFPAAQPGTLLRDPEPPATVPQTRARTSEDAEGGSDGDPGAEDARGEGPRVFDPWARAFSACLREREILDREPVPGTGSIDEPAAEEDGG